jgi:hypothetical protein
LALSAQHLLNEVLAGSRQAAIQKFIKCETNVMPGKFASMKFT